MLFGFQRLVSLVRRDAVLGSSVVVILKILEERLDWISNVVGPLQVLSFRR